MPICTRRGERYTYQTRAEVCSPDDAMESGPFTGLRLCLLFGAANAFRVSLALNTYTSVELAYATSYFTALNGTWTLANNSWWNGSATRCRMTRTMARRAGSDRLQASSSQRKRGPALRRTMRSGSAQTSRKARTSPTVSATSCGSLLRRVSLRAPLP